MDGLLELARRCEAATGADREMDMQITFAIGIVPEPYVRATFHGRPLMYFWNRTDSHAPYVTPERYTASLDAAMTLVPEGARALIDSDGCHCRLTRDGWPWGGYTGFAGTMPLAIVAVALRARAAK